MYTFISYLVIGFICAAFGYNLGKNRKIGANNGALLGFFLCAIGLAIVAFSPVIQPEGDDDDDNYVSYASPTEELGKLHALKEKGAISAEEYETLKQKLLSKI